MKNLIKALFLLFIIGMMNGCTEFKNNGNISPIIITNIESTRTQGMCLYKIDNDINLSGINMHWFIDTCGKFSVGDTLKLSK